MTPRRRLDVELVRRGLMNSRSQAQSAIDERKVLVSGALATRSARLVAPDEPIEIQGEARRFVGRGGEKLDAALCHFGIDVTGRPCLDVGASTGGFTDALLKKGAHSVVAVDVGYGQLDARLRQDSRVRSFERTNVRTVDLDFFARQTPPVDAPFDLVVVDVSFISLRSLTPVLLGPILRDGATAVMLVKPQFEVGRVEASKGKGVITEPSLWADAIETVASSCVASGAVIMDVMVSPLLGASGNTEFLLWARKGGDFESHQDVGRWRNVAMGER